MWVHHGVDAPTEVSPNGILIEPAELHRDVEFTPLRVNLGHPDTGKEVRRIEVQHELQPARSPLHFVHREGYLTSLRSAAGDLPAGWRAAADCYE